MEMFVKRIISQLISSFGTFNVSLSLSFSLSFFSLHSVASPSSDYFGLFAFLFIASKTKKYYPFLISSIFISHVWLVNDFSLMFFFFNVFLCVFVSPVTVIQSMCVEYFSTPIYTIIWIAKQI